MLESNSNPIVYLSGGLGNQLFQFASGLKLNSKTLSVNVSQTRGNFELFGFLDYVANKRGMQIYVETTSPTRLFIAVHNYILRSTQWRKSAKFENFLIFLAALAMRLRNPRELSCFITDNSPFEDLQLLLESNAQIHVIGYFQTQDVAKEIVIELKEYLDLFAVEEDKRNATKNNVVTVHVRRGDYSAEKRIGMLSLAYFKNAIEYFIEVQKNLEIRLFSNGDIKLDDLFTPLKIHGVTLVDSDSALHLLNEMRRGSIFIISNSTLSWWAGFLCTSPTKRVLYPDPWFRDLPKPVNLCPKTWEAFPSIWIEENDR